MADTLDITRWTDKPLGVGARRLAIASTGLRQMLRQRFFRFLIFLGGLSGILIAAAVFAFGQCLAEGGWLETFAARFGPRAEAVVSAVTGAVLLYPDIVVHGLFTAVFMMQAAFAQFLCLVALTVVVPRLITRDRASNALTIYLSRPITSFDYLAGKFGIIAGVLLCLWVGPLLAGWFLSVLFAPETSFLTYSLQPLGRALLYCGISLAVLAPLALGISSVVKTTAGTILIWMAAWIVADGIASIPFMPAWVRHLSFSYNLEILSVEIFKPVEVLHRAGAVLPQFQGTVDEVMGHIESGMYIGTTTGAVAGLVVLVAASLLVLLRRLRSG